jgi:hypothetical protein
MYSATTLFFVFATLAKTTSAVVVSQIAHNGQCLTVSPDCMPSLSELTLVQRQVANPNPGAAVTLTSCNSANNNQGSQSNQRWVISEGNNQGVELYDTGLCLDAQTPPAPGRPTLVYPCNGDNAQTWVR